VAILKIKTRDAIEGSENDQRKKYADTVAIIEERTVLNDTDPMKVIRYIDYAGNFTI
jgi:hypothetical protein